MTEAAVDIRTKYDVQRPATFLELWNEEAVDGQRLDFTTVPLPGSAGTTWLIDNGTDTPDETKSIDGIIVATRPYSALHLTKYDDRVAGESGRPDAWSNDGKTQFIPKETYAKIDELNEARRAEGKQELPHPSPNLAECPYALWPSDGGAGVLLGTTNRPQTRSYLELYVFTSLRPLPLKVRIPSMSEKRYIEYSNGILNEGIRPSGIETKISLRKVVAGGGKDYGEPVFTRGEVLAKDHAAEFKSFSDDMKQIVANGGLSALQSGAALTAPAPVQQIAAPVAPAAPVAAPVAPAAAPVEAPVAPVAAAEPATEAPVAVGAAGASDDVSLDDI